MWPARLDSVQLFDLGAFPMANRCSEHGNAVKGVVYQSKASF
jgi:hypothetical protein